MEDFHLKRKEVLSFGLRRNYFKTMVLKMWSTNQQQQYHPETFVKNAETLTHIRGIYKNGTDDLSAGQEWRRRHREPAPRLPSPSPLTRGRARLGRVTLSGRTTARSRGGGAGRQTPPYQRRAELRQTHIPGRPHGSGSSEVQWNLRTVARPVLSAAQPAPPPRSPEWLRPRGPVGGGEGVEETIPGEGRMS